MNQVVAFDYPYWVTTYPEFAAVGQGQAQGWFNRACLICDNTGCGPVTDETVGGQLYQLLHLLTAHIAKLNAPQGPPGQQTPASPLVGRVSNAQEGSVSLAVDYPDDRKSLAWFNQTPYGAEYVTATAQFRTMRYSPGWRGRAYNNGGLPFGFVRRPYSQW